jgi:phytoene dehydrogenase-like protein
MRFFKSSVRVRVRRSESADKRRLCDRSAEEIPPAPRSDYLIVREFSHEKDFAPENKNISPTMTFCDENTSKKFIALRRDKRTYSSVKRHLSDVIRRIIEEKFPELKNKLKLLDVWTPATYNRYVSSEMGSYMSFAMKAKFTPTRLRNRLRGAKNVILATQWLQAPGGLPIAAKGGMLAIKEIMRKEKRGFAY